MSKYAVGLSSQGIARFFTGEYLRGDSQLETLSPIITAKPDKARAYEDRVVAEIIAAFLNILASIHAGKKSEAWSVIELPEAWTS